MDINPEYQREVVWTEQRMVHLIDSLFNNYYVPPLIFKVISGVKEGTNERRKWRTCIDGKQRLTTIQKFFDGEIPYVDKKRNKWYQLTNLPLVLHRRSLVSMLSFVLPHPPLQNLVQILHRSQDEPGIRFHRMRGRFYRTRERAVDQPCQKDKETVQMESLS